MERKPPLCLQLMHKTAEHPLSEYNISIYVIQDPEKKNDCSAELNREQVNVNPLPPSAPGLISDQRDSTPKRTLFTVQGAERCMPPSSCICVHLSQKRSYNIFIHFLAAFSSKIQ